jgi:hypothetical protein
MPSNPKSWPAALPLLADSLERTLSANASLIIETVGPPTPPLQTGSAQLAATNNGDGFAIFHNVITAQQAAVPLESRAASSYLLAFDNTNGTATGVAINTVSTKAVKIPVVVRDDKGAQIDTDTLNLPTGDAASADRSQRDGPCTKRRGWAQKGGTMGKRRLTLNRIE